MFLGDAPPAFCAGGGDPPFESGVVLRRRIIRAAREVGQARGRVRFEVTCGLEDVSRRRVEVVEGLEPLFQLMCVGGMFFRVDGVDLCYVSFNAARVLWL